MSNIVILACPECTAKIEIEPNVDCLACAYCRTEYLVQGSGGATQLTPVVEGLKEIDPRDLDKTHPELSISQLTSEIDALDREIAVLGKQKERVGGGAAIVLGTFAAVVGIAAIVSHSLSTLILAAALLGYSCYSFRGAWLRGARLDAKHSELLSQVDRDRTELRKQSSVISTL